MNERFTPVRHSRSTSQHHHVVVPVYFDPYTLNCFFFSCPDPQCAITYRDKNFINCFPGHLLQSVNISAIKLDDSRTSSSLIAGSFIRKGKNHFKLQRIPAVICQIRGFLTPVSRDILSSVWCA